MLERIDRLALAVHDASVAAQDFAAIFDSEIVSIQSDVQVGAMRTTLQWGQDQIELLEPTGDGAVARFMQAGRSGIFAGGFALADPSALVARLRDQLVVHEQVGGRFVILPEDLGGTGVILAPRVERERVGLNDKIWQLTYALPELGPAVARYTGLFGLHDDYTNYYTSDTFGYEGAITWFDARDGGLLDSLEYLEPNDPTKAVARFVRRNGTGIYMASIETDAIPEIKARVTATGDGWQGTDFGGFIHPKRLHGLLLALVTYKDWNARRPLPEAPAA
jgi:hypothetical protein